MNQTSVLPHGGQILVEALKTMAWNWPSVFREKAISQC
jgi:hypothetical protein